MMRFSVLTPVYNAEEYLNECILSVLNQTEQDFELVLIDDGSTDGSGVLADAAAAAHPGKIRVFHQENRGLIAARRAGIAQARGEVCLFLDADDALEPDTLSVVAASMEETGADMVLFDYANVYDAAGRAVPCDPAYVDGTVFAGRDKAALYGELIRGWRLNNLCTKAIQTKLLKGDPTDYAPYYGNPHTEDLLQTLYPITEARRIVYRALPLYRYRRRCGSMSQIALRGGIERQWNQQVMDLLRAYMDKWGMDGPDWLLLYHTRRLFNLISLFWQHYRAAKTAGEKRAALSYDWAGLLTKEDGEYLRHNGLDRAKKLQLSAILHKNKPLLDLFLLVGGARMRARHGGQ